MLSLEEKVGQMMMVGFHGLEPPKYLLEWLAEGRIGGVILFARNIASPAQLAALTKACHEAAARPIMIAIDQEGGVVARLRKDFSESPGAMALGVADSEALAHQVSGILAKEMRTLGINWNLAPTIDITHNIHNPSVGVRSLGTDVGRVKALGIAQLTGFQNAGVAATGKHFPGKANTPVDPHVSLPVIDTPVDDMWDVDLVPFRAASEVGLAAMMITHVQFKSLEPEYPSTLSPRVIQGLLREDIGFKGVVTTDCMEMGAITKKYGASESAVLAALAGANIILFSHTRAYQEEICQAVLQAVRSGRLPEEKVDFAVGKISGLKERFAITNQPSTKGINKPEHRAIMVDAAQRGTVQVHSQADVLPIKPDDSRQVALIEFVSVLDSDASERGDRTSFAVMVTSQLPSIKTISLNPGKITRKTAGQARDLAATSDLVIVATRSAHLNPDQQIVAQDLLKANDNNILLCLRNPYDAGVLGNAQTVICTCGDSTPSLTAAVEVLTGQYTPTGKLPVPLTMDA